MYKELIISAIVIILVIVVNFVMGKLVDDKLNRVIDLLAETRTAIEDKDYEKANGKVEEIDKHWESSERFLSCYIEHDELEKVETEFTSLKACLEIEEEDCLEYIDRMSFVVEHIEKKDDFVLENMF
ncbi:MAG: DUF4363 family protein [Clostridia bacterium]|jgi:hypothetical protein|nr:DUF4363 family protein [Clostridia bacterium]